MAITARKRERKAIQRLRTKRRAAKRSRGDQTYATLTAEIEKATIGKSTTAGLPPQSTKRKPNTTAGGYIKV
ncbi:hypothetical protein WN982_28045 [Paraburkholderia sp. IMGN_8]|uniref:hypothetical protein n=1 Tax=Paraburkholderia sp. IMGN_8 TaxID=3136564 RepID=UPI003100D9A6